MHKLPLSEEQVRWARVVARGIGSRWHDVLTGSDLIGVADLALCEAHLRYDPDRGPLEPYARHVIWSRISRAGRAQRTRWQRRAGGMLECLASPSDGRASARLDLRAVLRWLGPSELTVAAGVAAGESPSAVARRLGHHRSWGTRIYRRLRERAPRLSRLVARGARGPRDAPG